MSNDKLHYEASHDPEKDKEFWMATDPSVDNSPHGVGYSKEEAAEDFYERLSAVQTWRQRTEGSSVTSSDDFVVGTIERVVIAQDIEAEHWREGRQFEWLSGNEPLIDFFRNLDYDLRWMHGRESAR